MAPADRPPPDPDRTAQLAGSASGEPRRLSAPARAFWYKHSPLGGNQLAQNPSAVKRQKELARLDKQREKEAKRKQRKAEKDERVKRGESGEVFDYNKVE